MYESTFDKACKNFRYITLVNLLTRPLIHLVTWVAINLLTLTNRLLNLLKVLHRLHTVTNLLLLSLPLKLVWPLLHTPPVSQTNPVNLPVLNRCTVPVKGPLKTQGLKLPRTNRIKLFLPTLLCKKRHFNNERRQLPSKGTALVPIIFFAILRHPLTNIPKKLLTFLLVFWCKVLLATVTPPVLTFTTTTQA